MDAWRRYKKGCADRSTPVIKETDESPSRVSPRLPSRNPPFSSRFFSSFVLRLVTRPYAPRLNLFSSERNLCLGTGRARVPAGYNARLPSASRWCNAKHRETDDGWWVVLALGEYCGIRHPRCAAKTAIEARNRGFVCRGYLRKIEDPTVVRGSRTRGFPLPEVHLPAGSWETTGRVGPEGTEGEGKLRINFSSHRRIEFSSPLFARKSPER